MSAATVAPHPLAAYGLDMLVRGAARLRGDRLAMSDAGEGADASSLTFRDLDRVMQAFAARCWECGLAPGDRIVIVGAPRVSVMAAVLGALSAGIEPTIAPAHLDAPALAFLAQGAGARAIFAPTRFGETEFEPVVLEAAAIASDVRFLGSLGPDAIDDAIDFSPAALQDAPPQTPRAPRSEAPPRLGFVLQPDSKAPRAAFLSQSDVVGQALDLVAHLAVSSDAPVVSTLSLASLAGMVAGPVLALLAGSRAVLFGPFSSQSFIATLDAVGRCHLAAPETIGPDLAQAGIGVRLEGLALSRAAGAAATPYGRIGCPTALIEAGGDGHLAITRPAA